GVALTVNTTTPADLGSLAEGDTVSEASSSTLKMAQADFYIFDAATPLLLSGSITGDNNEMLSAALLNESNQQLLRITQTDTPSFTGLLAPTGTTLLRVKALADTPAYQVNLSADAVPQFEV